MWSERCMLRIARCVIDCDEFVGLGNTWIGKWFSIDDTMPHIRHRSVLESEEEKKNISASGFALILIFEREQAHSMNRNEGEWYWRTLVALNLSVAGLWVSGGLTNDKRCSK